MPWYQTWGGNFVDKTSKEEWSKCMSDDRVITLEDRSAGWGTYTAILSSAILSTAPEKTSIYDLQGNRLSKAPAKGIFIKDGRMVFKK